MNKCSDFRINHRVLWYVPGVNAPPIIRILSSYTSKSTPSEDRFKQVGYHGAIYGFSVELYRRFCRVPYIVPCLARLTTQAPPSQIGAQTTVMSLICSSYELPSGCWSHVRSNHTYTCMIFLLCQGMHVNCQTDRLGTQNLGAIRIVIRGLE